MVGAIVLHPFPTAHVMVGKTGAAPRRGRNFGGLLGIRRGNNVCGQYLLRAAVGV